MRQRVLVVLRQLDLAGWSWKTYMPGEQQQVKPGPPTPGCPMSQVDPSSPTISSRSHSERDPQLILHWNMLVFLFLSDPGSLFPDSSVGHEARITTPKPSWALATVPKLQPCVASSRLGAGPSHLQPVHLHHP